MPSFVPNTNDQSDEGAIPNTKKKVLFVTQSESDSCGVAFAGNMLAETLVKSSEYDFIIFHATSARDVDKKVKEISPDAIIYNYHKRTLSWIDNKFFLKRHSKIPSLKIHYDVTQVMIDNFNPTQHGGYKYLITNDPTLKGSEHVFVTTRVIPPFSTIAYQEKEIPVIGFQGFGAPFKGIAKLASIVQEEFDNAIIRLHIPPATYGSDLKEALKRVAEVKAIVKKPGISILSSHQVLSTKDLVDMMAQNTINCYFYDYLDGAGIATSPDYAIAARRPIAITKSHQLRHLSALTPSICIEDNSLKSIIALGAVLLEPLYKAYTEENLLRDYKIILNKIIG